MNTINITRKSEKYATTPVMPPYTTTNNGYNISNMKTPKTEVRNLSRNSERVNKVSINGDLHLDNLLSNTAEGKTTNTNTVEAISSKPQERYVWEMRAHSPQLTPSSTVLNSPDLNTDMQYTLHPHQRQVQQIHVGRSPGCQFEQQNIVPQDLTSPGSPTDMEKSGDQCLRDGEIVVFDDINTNWMNKSNNNYNSQNAPSPSTMRNIFHNNEDVLKVTKMIGQLPIADYDGSPRRFGNQTLKKATFSKRPPGFPQRVSPLSTLTPQQEMQHQQQQEAAHIRHQQMQQQHQFYAQATCNNTTSNSPKSTLSCKNYNHNVMENLIDIDSDDASCSSTNIDTTNSQMKIPTFDYLYEFSETRKVLEEFFKANPDNEQFAEFTESPDDVASCANHNDSNEQMQNVCDNTKYVDKAYIGQRLARIPKDELFMVHRSPKKEHHAQQEQEICDVYKDNGAEQGIDSNSRSSCDLADAELEVDLQRHSRNFTLSPETTDYDSNCGDLDSLSNDVNCPTDFGKLYTSMPILEDGLSSGHTSDTENNCPAKYAVNVESKSDASMLGILPKYDYQLTHQKLLEQNNCNNELKQEKSFMENDVITNLIDNIKVDINLHSQNQISSNTSISSSAAKCCDSISVSEKHNMNHEDANGEEKHPSQSKQSPLDSFEPQLYQEIRDNILSKMESAQVQDAMNEIKSALQRAKTQPEKLKLCDEVLPPGPESPVWVPRKIQINSNNIINSNNTLETISHCDEEEQDTDLETDRLLGQQRTDDREFLGEKDLWSTNSRFVPTIESIERDKSPTTSDISLLAPNCINLKPQSFSSANIRHSIETSLASKTPENSPIITTSNVAITTPERLQYTKSPTGSIKSLKNSSNCDKKVKTRNKEVLLESSVLIEGVLFRARYLGSTQLVCEGQPTKSTRMMQAEEAVSRIKAPEGENQPSTEVDLFISTEKIMVLNTDLKEIMMDHALRSISYIADIGDLVVLMARRRFVHTNICNSNSVTSTNNDTDISMLTNTFENGDHHTVTVDSKDNDCKEKGCINSTNKHSRTPKMICHVFESDEAQFIAQSIGQAFQVAYMEFLKANGIENENLAKEMDYQEVLNSQEIFGDELEIFAKKELQKEVVVPKAKGEILGVVIVESGWGSMLPTVVIANLMSGGAAARCGQLNIGDQLIAINGLSLVGLPLSTCQNYIRNAKNQTAVKFTVVPCPPVVEVKILRPKALFQLGFSVQNGVICSLLRGGIAERGGVRVGHRIIEINNQSVVAVPHDTIVKLLSSSVGEILMKTMPTSMFRLLTGQETPIYI